MFSKLTAFRSSKEVSSQKGRKSQGNSYSSQQLHATKSNDTKSNIAYFSPKLPLDEESVSEISYDKLVFSYSDASPITKHVSDGNSSTDSVGLYSTYDGKDSVTSSSLFEEIDVGPSVLLPYEDAEEDFLEDHEGYFLNLSVNNVRKDQYPRLELQRIVYLDYATCPLYSRFQLYGSSDLKHRGSILAFNVLDFTGNVFPARLVQQLARRSNIFLDACGLGDIDMANLLYSKANNQVDKLFASRCSDEVIRLSLGPVSTFDDIYRLAQFLSRFRDEEYMSSEAAGYVEKLENEY